MNHLKAANNGELQPRGAPVEKVTAFVMGRRAGVAEMLFLYHPYAGIQLPAGTVEPGEGSQEAAPREAREETGLDGLEWGALLGEECYEFSPGEAMVALTTPVYVRPDVRSNPMGSLRRGFTIEVKRAMGDFLQVRYAESDHDFDAQAMSFELLGWVPVDAISGVRIRYFAWLRCSQSTPPRWTHEDDYHTFTLCWHRLDDLPELVASQAPWLRYLDHYAPRP